jgi:hypothetical protein
MTKINSATLTNFCNKYRIKYEASSSNRYVNYSPINYSKFASEYVQQIETSKQYNLTIDERMLYRLVEQDVQIEEEERLRMHNITVRAAWEQYQMAVNLCRSYYAQD